MSGKICGYAEVTGQFARDDEEDMGTKQKFWLTRNSDQVRFLFKIGRVVVGDNPVENWAEVAAAELCARLDIPHAPYELVVYDGQRGTISEDFRHLTLPGGERVAAAFEPANETLGRMRRDYPVKGKRRLKKYTVGVCAAALRWMEADAESRFPAAAARPMSMPGIFCGYLLLDALIGNSDRHHENWGFIVAKEGAPLRPQFAPTFDHAASFCREPAAKLRERLNTRDLMRKADAYCRSPKARSALSDADGRPLSHLAAFAEMRRLVPAEAEVWLGKLRQLNPRRDLTFAFGDSCPAAAVAPETREFAMQMVEVNRERLLTLPE